MAGGDLPATGTASGSATPTATSVPNQAGILEGLNPTHYNPADPIVLFIIQTTIIIVACRLLHWPLSKVRQPQVIAEVIGGIILGPTVMGRIPGFQQTIFPKESMPMLSLAANLGLILFLFLVGLEVDMRLLMSNWKTAVSVGCAGMMLPFGLGAALAYGLYHQFRLDDGGKHISFGIYLLFVGVAMAITAFPVLARILTELKLLHTNVGTITLSAGVGNDVVGWILLALTVALVNAGTGLSALYVLLVAVGYTLFLIYAVRPVFIWLLRRTGSLENGPTQAMVGLTLLMVLASAFFTNIIGVHAIFGGFLIGLICPHEGGFAVQLTEKIEDLVTVLFLPLYFALSGLRTNIGLLDSGIVWGYVFAVVFVAFFGKIVGGTLAAKVNGLLWRESFTIGVLMSCKGLVELIVLNIGLQAGILSTRVFTIFVVMALVTTFATTPLVSWLYPPSYQYKLERWRRGEIDWEGKELTPEDGTSAADTVEKEKAEAMMRISKVTVLLRLENLPTIFTFVDLLGGKALPQPKVHKLKQNTIISEEQESSGTATPPRPKRPVEVHGVRLLELDQRTSSVMQVSEVGEKQEKDPVLNVFRTFGAFHNLNVWAGISIAPEDSFAEVLASKSAEQSSDLLMIPWTETGAVADSNDPQGSTENRFVSHQHNSFIARALASATCSTAIMVNRGFGSGADRGLTRSTSFHSLRSRIHADVLGPLMPISDPSHHLFLPFFGGVDDHLALRFILQLADNIHVTATIVHVIYNPDADADETDVQMEGECTNMKRKDLPRNLSQTHIPTVNDDASPETPSDADSAFFHTMADSLSSSLANRVVFETAETSKPLHYAVSRAHREVGQSSKNSGDLIVLGRSAREERAFIRKELAGVLESLGSPSGAGVETRSCLGDVAEAMVVLNKGSVLVLQAAGKLKDA